jgi:hypothetical protein
MLEDFVIAGLADMDTEPRAVPDSVYPELVPETLGLFDTAPLLDTLEVTEFDLECSPVPDTLFDPRFEADLGVALVLAVRPTVLEFVVDCVTDSDAAIVNVPVVVEVLEEDDD